MNSSSDSYGSSAMTPGVLRHLVTAIWRRFRDGRCAQVAGSLAFTTLLSLVPFVTLVVVMFTRFPQSARFGDALKGFLLDNLLPDKAGKVIATYAFQFSQKSTNLTIVGGVALIFTALMLMKTIDQVINQIWMVRSTRPWATRLAAYWVALSVGPVLIAGCVFVSTAIIGMSLDLVGEPVWLEAFALRLIPLVLLTGIFTAVYYAVPHCTVRLIDAATAGLFAAMAFVVMQRLFGLYLVHFPSYTLVYGAFAVVPIFLLWLYLSWIVILLGAVMAAVLPERTHMARPLPDFPGRRGYVAMVVLAQLVRAQRDGSTLDVASLARVARVGHDEVRDVLETSQRARIVARSDGGGWLLARAAETVSVAEVARLFTWGLPPDESVPPVGQEALVRRQWSELLLRLDSVSDLPLSALADDGAQSG